MKGLEAAEWFRNTWTSLRSEIGKVVVGQDDVVEGVLVALAANGHVLLEGMPGLGKTLLIRTMAQAVDLDFSRIQFTPDMMPADVTGTNVFTQAGGFEFRRGPVFAHFVLADEINRATPKTQSSLLEAMQERQVTVGGKVHHLDEPFMVMATQNPVEQEGTYPLPEAQLDRFFFKLLVPYPSKAVLAEVVNRTTQGEMAQVQRVASAEDLIRARQITREVSVSPEVLDYALSIIVASHPDSESAATMAKKYVRYGSSPRGAQAIITAGKVFAMLEGRFNVSKENVVKAAKPVLRHRLIMNYESEADGVTADQVVDGIVEMVNAGDKDPIKV
ncbi:AAA family ATPase [Armatimonadetes bacterium Uphvl-Ar1]|nr:AAA family ATPase [Armatimonadetes bacterium Uphvl-Ar1]